MDGDKPCLIHLETNLTSTAQGGLLLPWGRPDRGRNRSTPESTLKGSSNPSNDDDDNNINNNNRERPG